MMKLTSLHMRARSAGFTLIEAIIASGIALLVFGVGYTAIATTVTASNIASARIRDTENARLFFNMLERDLATAVPGPTYMTKTVLPLTQTPPSQYNSIVLNEPDGQQQRSDLIQFYCRTDHPGAPGDPFEPILFVRYGFCHHPSAKVIFRQSVTAVPPNQDLDQITTGALNPLELTSETTPNPQISEGLALFDNVSQLKITLQRWDPLNRKYIPPVTVNSADSILVTIIFGDEGNKTPHATTQVTRTYSKIFQLPTSFQ